MTAVGDTVNSGSAMTNYISKNFRADLVVVHNLSDGLPPMGMWNEMQLHLDRYRAKYARRPIDKPGIMLVLSPSAEESKRWGEKDWHDFCWEFVHELDKVDEVVSKGRKHKVKPTNLANSQFFAGLHRDSKSGILHLHLLGNRIDMLGNINDAHFIGDRAVKAAAIINLRHGWKNPMEIREEHKLQIINDCMDVLRNLPRFEWWLYETELKKRGYEVKLNRDSLDMVRGYTIKMGNSTFKASELGKDRKLLASKLYRTWVQLHSEQQKEIREYTQPNQNEKSLTNPMPLTSKRDENNGEYPVKRQISKPVVNTTSIPEEPALAEMYHDSFNVGERTYDIKIPKSAYEMMKGLVEVADNAAQTVEDVLRVSMLLFLNYADAATTVSESLGGGGGVGSDWGRRKDDDDELWARRCALKANWLCKPFRRTMKR